MTLDVDLAWQVYQNSFFTTPWHQRTRLQHRVGSWTVLRYDYVAAGQHVLVDNLFVRDTQPHAVLDLLTNKAFTRLKRVRVWVQGPESYEPFLAAGYHIREWEQLMYRPLEQLPPLSNHYPVQRIRTADEFAAFNTMADAELLHPEDFPDPRLQFYGIFNEQQVVARARTMHLEPFFSWVSHVRTLAAYRRLGIAQTLMTALLHHSATHAHYSLLLATEHGYPLYQKLGYQRICTLINLDSEPMD